MAAFVGLGFSLWLTFIEEYVLQVWRLYCVISQVIIALETLLTLGSIAAERLGREGAASQV
jgi:uncharacterized membrane protein